jgi:hypothetical protein
MADKPTEMDLRFKRTRRRLRGLRSRAVLWLEGKEARARGWELFSVGGTGALTIGLFLIVEPKHHYWWLWALFWLSLASFLAGLTVMVTRAVHSRRVKKRVGERVARLVKTADSKVTQWTDGEEEAELYGTATLDIKPRVNLEGGTLIDASASPNPKPPEPGIDAPGEHTATTRDPCGGEDIERRTFEREHRAHPGVADVGVEAHGANDPPTRERPLSSLGRTFRRLNEAAASSFAPTGREILDAAIDAAIHEPPGDPEAGADEQQQATSAENASESEPEILVIDNPDADWSNWPERIRHGVRLRIQRPRGDRGRIDSCQVTRIADGRTWTYVPGMTPMGPMLPVGLGLNTADHEVEFPRGFQGAGSRAQSGRYMYRWTAVYGESAIPTSSDTVAEGEFSI